MIHSAAVHHAGAGAGSRDQDQHQHEGRFSHSHSMDESQPHHLRLSPRITHVEGPALYAVHTAHQNTPMTEVEFFPLNKLPQVKVSQGSHQSNKSSSPNEDKEAMIGNGSSEDSSRHASIFAYMADHVYKIVDGSLPDSIISRFLSYILMAVILFSFIVSFMATMPQYKYFPKTCSQPVCNDHPVLCPEVIICEPQPFDIFVTMGNVCMMIFTAEYGLKLITCWAVSSRDLGIISNSWVGSTTDKPPVYNIVEHYLRYIFLFKNLVDLITILPYCISLETSGQQHSFLVFLRVFRVIRVLKFFEGLKKFEEVQIMATLLTSTLFNSVEALMVLVGFVFLAMIFFGSIIYSLEMGKFQVTADYPEGRFLRTTSNGVDVEISPFYSIPTSMYWVIVTATTVGYGDIAPTSWAGRMVASILCLTGLLVLALPIGVIGSNFTDLYNDLMDSRLRAASIKRTLHEMNDSELIALFNKMDAENMGYLDIFDLKDAFDESGVICDKQTFVALFADADGDGDGKVSWEEFKYLCEHLRGNSDVEHPTRKGTSEQRIGQIEDALPSPDQRVETDVMDGFREYAEGEATSNELKAQDGKVSTESRLRALRLNIKKYRSELMHLKSMRGKLEGALDSSYKELETLIQCDEPVELSLQDDDEKQPVHEGLKKFLAESKSKKAANFSKKAPRIVPDNT